MWKIAFVQCAHSLFAHAKICLFQNFRLPFCKIFYFQLIVSTIQFNDFPFFTWIFPFVCEGPRYLNFGAIGTAIGHEITHAFDNTGRHFDSNGDYSRFYLGKDNFDDKAECIVHQYMNYTDPLTGSKVGKTIFV